MNANQDALRYIDYYHRGVLTASEVATKIVELATSFDLATVAAETPKEILAQVGRRAVDIPNPEDVTVFLIGPGFVKGSQQEREAQERIIAGLRAWKSYFESAGERVTYGTSYGPNIDA